MLGKPGRTRYSFRMAKKLPARNGAPLHVWLPAPLLAAFGELLKQTRRSKTAEVELMMEQYLERQGLWPAPDVPKRKGSK
jgi:hypothetical protein